MSSVGRVTDLPCVNVIYRDPEDPEKGLKKCGVAVPRWQWPADRHFPIVCDGCLRALQTQFRPKELS